VALVKVIALHLMAYRVGLLAGQCPSENHDHGELPLCSRVRILEGGGMDLQQELADSLEKLAALGDVEHIAAFLHDSNILAQPNSDLRGPVAAYLRERLDTPWASSNADSVVVARDGDLTELPLPPVVQEFSKAFNSHQFVELEADVGPRAALHRRLVESVAWLEGLGDPEAIATFLRNRGIPGTPNAATDCAIGLYLRSRLDTQAVAVSRRDAATSPGGHGGCGALADAAGFGHQFDQPDLPALLKPKHKQAVCGHTARRTARHRLLRLFRR